MTRGVGTVLSRFGNAHAAACGCPPRQMQQTADGMRHAALFQCGRRRTVLLLKPVSPTVPFCCFAYEEAAVLFHQPRQWCHFNQQGDRAAVSTKTTVLFCQPRRRCHFANQGDTVPFFADPGVNPLETSKVELLLEEGVTSAEIGALGRRHLLETFRGNSFSRTHEVFSKMRVVFS